ncbi:MAG: DegV family protein, partial [Anaerolineae bacterium]
LLDTLEYLERGGRAAALMPVVKRVAQALSIKPILNLVEGELRLVSAARSYERGLGRLVQEAVARAPWELVGVLHARVPQAAEAVADRLAQETGFPRSAILVMETGSVLSSHGGPGVLGTIVVTKKPS